MNKSRKDYLEEYYCFYIDFEDWASRARAFEQGDKLNADQLLRKLLYYAEKTERIFAKIQEIFGMLRKRAWKYVQ